MTLSKHMTMTKKQYKREEIMVEIAQLEWSVDRDRELIQDLKSKLYELSFGDEA